MLQEPGNLSSHFCLLDAEFVDFGLKSKEMTLKREEKW